MFNAQKNLFRVTRVLCETEWNMNTLQTFFINQTKFPSFLNQKEKSLMKSDSG